MCLVGYLSSATLENLCAIQNHGWFDIDRVGDFLIFSSGYSRHTCFSPHLHQLANRWRQAVLQNIDNLSFADVSLIRSCYLSNDHFQRYHGMTLSLLADRVILLHSDKAKAILVGMNNLLSVRRSCFLLVKPNPPSSSKESDAFFHLRSSWPQGTKVLEDSFPEQPASFLLLTCLLFF